eukprot:m.99455 g.99455  ORF g.99455 m.99455 type:complete len:2084 (+) comp12463_c1_seq1:77-6328(+)
MGKGDKRRQRAALSDRGSEYLFAGEEKGGKLHGIAEGWNERAQGAVFQAACRILCTDPLQRKPLVAELQTQAQGAESNEVPADEAEHTVQLLQRMYLGAPRAARRQLKIAFSAVSSIASPEDVALWCSRGVAETLTEGVAGRPRIAVLARLFECPEAGLEVLATPEQMATWVELLGSGLASKAELDVALKATAVTCKRFLPSLSALATSNDRLRAGLSTLAAQLPKVLHEAGKPGIDDKEMCGLAGLVMATCLQIGEADDRTTSQLMCNRLVSGETSQDAAALPTQPWYPAVSRNVGDIANIGLLRGILSAATITELLVDVNDGVCLLEVVFFKLFELVDTNTTAPILNFFSHSTVSFWLKTVHDAAKASPKDLQATLDFTLVGCDLQTTTRKECAGRTTRIVDRILQETWETWEHPVTEIRAIAKSNFEAILAIYELQSKNNLGQSQEGLQDGLESRSRHLVERLARSLMDMPWHVKGRYGPLCEVVKRLKLPSLKSNLSSVLGDVVQCLSVNMLSRCATKLWNALLMCALNDIRENGTSDPVEVWVELFWPAFDSAICSDNELARANCVMYLLPSTLDAFPEVTVALMKVYLRELHGCVQVGETVESAGSAALSEVRPTSGLFSKDKGLRAVIALGQAARSRGLLSASKLLSAGTDSIEGSPVIPRALVIAALGHTDPQIQMDALALVACDKRSTTGVSDAEIDLVLTFLADNGCVVLNATRQRFLSTLKDFFLRLASSLQSSHAATVAADKNLISMDKAGMSLKKMAPHVKESDRLDRVKEEASERFVRVYEHIEELCIASLSPGSSYPRAVTAIHTWLLLNDTMGKMTLMDAAPPTLPPRQSVRNAKSILGATMSSRSDVRSAASSLLAHMFERPVCLRHGSLQYDEMGSGIPHNEEIAATATSLLKSSWRMISSQSTSSAESGAQLLATTVHHYTLTYGFVVRVADSEVMVPGALVCDLPMAKCDAALTSCRSLMSVVVSAVEQTKADIPGHCRSKTIFGSISAMSHLWPLLRKNFEADLVVWKDFINDWVDFLCAVGQWVLALLSPTQTAVTCGSFADVDSTLESLAHLSAAGEERTHPPLPDQDDTKEHILSLAWRTIAAISDFFGGAFAHLPIAIESEAMASHSTTLLRARAIATWFHSVLLGVRHRGAIESCAAGFEKFCARLMTSSVTDVSQVPLNILTDSLAFVKTTTTISVTRRGAGAPHVIKAVLTNCRNSAITRTTIESLLQVAAVAPISHQEIDDLSDLPQVRAFNVLTVIVSDGAIAEDIQPFLTTALVTAVSGFQSPIWAITNAATIAYAALLHRMLGMKRVRKDSSHINSITAQEFFSRYPPLRNFLHKHLAAAVDQRDVAPFLAYPILTLLSKLACGGVETASSGETELHGLRRDFLDLVEVFINNPILQLRELASASLTPLFPMNELLPQCAKWLNVVASAGGNRDSISSVSNHMGWHESLNRSTNGLHGALLCAHEFLSRALADSNQVLPLDSTALGAVLSALTSCSWVLKPRYNSCAVLSVTYVHLLHDLLCSGKSNAVVEKNVISLLTTITDALLPREGLGIAQSWLNEEGVKVVFTALSCSIDPEVKEQAWRLLEHESSEVRHMAMSSCGEQTIHGNCLFELDSDRSRLQALCQRGLLSLDTDADTGGYFCACVSVYEMIQEQSVSATECWTLESAMASVDVLFSKGVNHPNIRVQEHSLRCLGLVVARINRGCREDPARAEKCRPMFKKYGEQVQLAAAYDAPTSLRLASAHSLGHSCGLLLNDPTLVSDGLRLVIHALCDDDSDVRDAIAIALPPTLGLTFSLQPYPSIRALLQWVENHAEELGYLTVWNALNGALLNFCPSGEVSEAGAALFEKENDNLYVEPVWVNFMLARSMVSIADQLPASAAEPIRDLSFLEAQQIVEGLVPILRDLVGSQERLRMSSTGVFNPTDRSDTVLVYVLTSLSRLVCHARTAISAVPSDADDFPAWPGVDDALVTRDITNRVPRLDEIYRLGTMLNSEGRLPLVGEMMLSMLHQTLSKPPERQGDWELAASLIAMQLLATARSGHTDSIEDTGAPTDNQPTHQFENPLPTGFPFL